VAEFASEDLRAAVGAGVLTEAQAAQLEVIAERRHGFRRHMVEEDEPFELFSGFAEIFVAVGIAILFGGIAAAFPLFWMTGTLTLIPLLGIVLSWVFAEYFTRRRRMAFPSILLTLIFAASITALIVVYLKLPETIAMSSVLGGDSEFLAGRFLTVALAGLVGMLIWFFRFRVPFTMLVAGLFGLGAVFSVTALFDPTLIRAALNPVESMFNLAGSSTAAIAVLAFGLIAFTIAMIFDMRDPYRISRLGRSAFWLHVLAAPALVNVTAYTFWSMGGTTGLVLTCLTLFFVTLLALIIDRRSFLTAGLIYLALLLGLAMTNTGSRWAEVYTLLILGVFVTFLGSHWTRIRASLMRALPDFPGKNRLPPFADGLATE